MIEVFVYTYGLNIYINMYMYIFGTFLSDFFPHVNFVHWIFRGKIQLLEIWVPQDLHPSHIQNFNLIFIKRKGGGEGDCKNSFDFE